MTVLYCCLAGFASTVSTSWKGPFFLGDVLAHGCASAMFAAEIKHEQPCRTYIRVLVVIDRIQCQIFLELESVGSKIKPIRRAVVSDIGQPLRLCLLRMGPAGSSNEKRKAEDQLCFDITGKA